MLISSRRLLRAMFLISVAAVLIPTKPLAASAPEGGSPDPEKTAVADDSSGWSILDEDEPEVWEVVDSFAAGPSAENTPPALAILDDVLVDWSSHPPGVVTTILDAIAAHGLESGRYYLSKFASADPQRPYASYVIRHAAFALGEMGGPTAFAELEKMAENGPGQALWAVASALGKIGDRRAVPILEALSRNSDPQVRQSAVSSLAKYCAPSSGRIVIENSRHPNAGVRNSATFWLASCGREEHATFLASLLEDDDELVRTNALRGLLRLNSREGCARATELRDTGSCTDQKLAEGYVEMCESGRER